MSMQLVRPPVALTDPFLPFVPSVEFPTNVLGLPSPEETAIQVASAGVKIHNFFNELFSHKREESTTSPPTPSAPGNNLSGGVGDEKPPSKPPGRSAKFSDFKTAAKVAATSAAISGGILAVNEATKPAIENLGKAFDNAAQAVSDAIEPITNPLGLDEKTKDSVGKLIVIGAIIGGIVLFAGVLLKK